MRSRRGDAKAKAPEKSTFAKSNSQKLVRGRDASSRDRIKPLAQKLSFPIPLIYIIDERPTVPVRVRLLFSNYKACPLEVKVVDIAKPNP